MVPAPSQPQTHVGSPRRERKGKRRKPESEQVAGLFCALYFSTEMATSFPFFNHLITPSAFPTLPPQAHVPYPDHLPCARDEGFPDAQLRRIEVEFPRVCLNNA